MILRCLALLLASLAGSVAASSHADDWGALATVSSTLGMNAGRLCIAEGARGDLGCPTYAPSLTTAGHVSVTGNLSAAKFIGDGAGLTNLLMQGDRISTSGVVSGAQLGAVVADQGTVSFTLAGTAGAAYLHPTLGLVAAGVSTTGKISATAAYFTGNVGIGGAQPSARTLEVSGSLRISSNYSNGWGSEIYLENTTGVSLSNTLGPRINFLNNVASRHGYSMGIMQTDDSQFVIRNTSSPWNYFFGLDQSGNIGIGNINPSATLHVGGTARFDSNTEIRGTVSATTVKLAESPANTCTAASAGTIKFSNGRPYICRYP